MSDVGARMDAAVDRIERAAAHLTGAPKPEPEPMPTLAPSEHPTPEHPWGPWADTNHGVLRFCEAQDCPAVQAHPGRPVSATPPHVITRPAVLDLLRALGLEPTNVRQVVIEPHRITVTERRLGADGRPLVAGDELATVTTTIGIQ